MRRSYTSFPSVRRLGSGLPDYYSPEMMAESAFDFLEDQSGEWSTEDRWDKIVIEGKGVRAVKQVATRLGKWFGRQGWTHYPPSGTNDRHRLFKLVDSGKGYHASITTYSAKGGGSLTLILGKKMR